MKLKHITTGQAGIWADTANELDTGVALLQAAGYLVDNIEHDDLGNNDPDAVHAATVHYTGVVAGIRAIKTVLGL